MSGFEFTLPKDTESAKVWTVKDGVIHCDSAVGQGTRFTLTFPHVQAAGRPSRAAQ